MKKLYRVSFKKSEVILWVISVIVLVLSFIISGSNLLYLGITIIGVTALLYLAKGEPLGQILVVIFSLSYSLVSLQLRYYSETITYALMTLPSALVAFISWMKHPYHIDKATVSVGRIQRKHIIFLIVITPLVTTLFYFILNYFQTPYIFISTLSIVTSFLASMFMIFRSRFYALFYIANDLVLIVLWGITSLTDISYVPIFLCFVIFLVHDAYAFINWKRLSIAQTHI